jgi:hypothetical protein
MATPESQLIAALERIRAGRVAPNMTDRLSDTEMARIAHEALTAAGVGAKITPEALMILK